MPRKTKEQKDTNLLKNDEINVTKKRSSGTKSKKVIDSNSKILKSSKKDLDKVVKDEKVVKATVSKNATKKSKNTKSETSKSSDLKDKKTSSKKVSTSKKKSSKTSVSKKDKVLKSKKIDLPEYYDLPYRYNQTIVKVLAQTPNNLFIYWDISDEDRENLKKQYGENFFEVTRPILIVHNDTLNYSFEVSINDFANSWYLHVNDSKSDYRIELGRRPINFNEFSQNVKIYQENNNIKQSSTVSDYIYISTSNEMEAPNDRILLRNYPNNAVTFCNIKTHEYKEKPITAFPVTKRIFAEHGIFDVAKLYEFLYKENNVNNIYNLSNPSSGNPSSGSLSSRFQ